MITLSSSEVALYYTSRVPDLAQRGKRWRGRCPIHHGQGYNFSVDPETGRWRCWSGCGRGGDIVALEMAMMGAAWRDAVAGIECIIGRALLDRPTTRAARRAIAERRERERRELREAELFRFTAMSMAEQILDGLPEAVPERYLPTQLLLELRAGHGVALLAIYRDWRTREPRLTAALVLAGERSWHRMCTRLARFVRAGMEVPNVA